MKGKDLQIDRIGGQVGLRRFTAKSGIVEGWEFWSWALNKCGGWLSNGDCSRRNFWRVSKQGEGLCVRLFRKSI